MAVGAKSFVLYLLLVTSVNTLADSYYAAKGNQVNVKLEAIYLANVKLQDLQSQNIQARIRKNILKTLTYLYGPTTNRQIGGISKVENVDIDFNNISIANNQMMIPYRYQAVWLISDKFIKKNEFEISIPFNEEILITENWKKCTDHEPIHQTQKLLWYYWDPQRNGCDHQLNVQYQNVAVHLVHQLAQDKSGRPDYQRLIQRTDGQHLDMTFAFGYINKESEQNPDTSHDQGMYSYRELLKLLRKNKLIKKSFLETRINLNEYQGYQNKNQVIGTRFKGIKDGIPVTIKVVTASNIDQMELFAKSYLQDHDSTFAWFGHSRVGEGFAASQVLELMEKNKNTFLLSPDFQILYWGGCNGYSYFTTPFFRMKAEKFSNNDHDRSNLNIISNALPTIENLSGRNAMSFFESIFYWEKSKSYKGIIDDLEVKIWNGKPSLINVIY